MVPDPDPDTSQRPSAASPPGEQRGAGPTRVLRRMGIWAAALILLTGVLYLVISPRLAETLLFFPDSSDPGAPPPVAGLEGRDVELTTADGVRIHGWWWSASDDAPAVVFFHGNAGNLAMRVSTAEGLASRGLSVFVLSYRGYGRSEGRPSEEGVLHDGRAALEWVSREVGGTHRVVLHGRSLGGFVAAGVGAEAGVAGVILESSFTTLYEIAREVYPILPRFLLGRLRGHFDNLDAVSRVEAPVLVIHGAADALIPPEMGERLHRRARQGHGWLPVEGAGHNDLPFVAGEDYFDQVATFVRRVTDEFGTATEG